MCLTTDNPEIRIATEDIHVFKNVTFTKRSFWDWLFRRPLKAYSTITGPYLYIQNVVQPHVELGIFYIEGFDTQVEEGYHSYVYYKKYQSNALFIIPKGTKYIQGYHNGDEEIQNYVSESIILVKKLN